ncbi:hypothetical protein GE061_013410 [Apolygus lucorum]|uniref:Reverse transcriptase domain-containing protein n=1 Tax=Apolygus lucorum TaxID=248454 RepID=A0A8S9XQH8_APOLU|nr:hypothetical protein GE061_013410 [Apolygus lucorum]
MIRARLMWWLENKQLLPPSQFGFRSNRSTLDAISHLVCDVQLGLTDNKTTLGLFLDVTSAYDNVDMDILYQKLINKGIGASAANNIVQLFCERSIFLRVDGELVGQRMMWRGLPQGSILSPILYVIYVSELDLVIPEGVKLLQYADDLCIYTTSRDPSTCRELLDEALLGVNDHLGSLGLRIAPHKSILCPFSRRRHSPFTEEVEIGGMLIPVARAVKFLGIHLTSKLDWSRHVNEILIKRNPWFYKVREAKPKSFYRNITRLRTGHGRTNSRIHLFDPLTLPACPHCPEDAETMTHIILECPQYEADRNYLLSSIPRDVTSPFNLDTLIAEEKLEVYECIDDFLDKIERSL